MNVPFNKYLEKQAFTRALFDANPDKDLEAIVIIPAFNETEMAQTIRSLDSCLPLNTVPEILVLVNQAEDCPEEISNVNNKTYEELITLKAKLANTKLHVCYLKNLPKKQAGAGLARKILMDEAVRRFNTIDNAQGVIFSLDADTTVSPNYLKDTLKAFKSNSKLNAGIFYFEHERNLEKYGADVSRAICIYEIYLRYFKLALHYTGFPYAKHTIGSCFAVRANAYVKQGGMNKRQGGEDFYFLQKIFQLGHCIELNQVAVYPSSRPSTRVPFGTGPAINKILSEGEYHTYAPKYFDYLHHFFTQTKTLYGASNRQLSEVFTSLDPSLQLFLNEEKFKQKIAEINKNAASPESFTKRFYQWMDAFTIIKYLNAARSENPKIGTIEAAGIFLKEKYHTAYKDLDDLLSKYQKIDREGRL